MIMADLAHLPHIRLVERDKIHHILHELKMSESNLLKDPHKLGRLLGASLIIGGEIWDDPTTEIMQISSFIADTETEETLHEQEAKGADDRFFALQKEIMLEIILELGIPEDELPPKFHDIHTEHPRSFEHFAHGIHFLDHGEYKKARTALETALNLDPGFKMAQEVYNALPKEDLSIEEIHQRLKKLMKKMETNMMPFGQKIKVKNKVKSLGLHPRPA